MGSDDDDDDTTGEQEYVEVGTLFRKGNVSLDVTKVSYSNVAIVTNVKHSVP